MDAFVPPAAAQLPQQNVFPPSMISVSRWTIALPQCWQIGSGISCASLCPTFLPQDADHLSAHVAVENVLLLWLFVAGSASADGRGALCLATPHLITWFAIAGGLAAWTAQLLGSYLLLDFGCAGVSGESGGLTAPLLAISAVCAAIALAATVAAGRRAGAARGAARALYGGGMLLDVLTLVTIVFGAAPRSVPYKLRRGRRDVKRSSTDLPAVVLEPRLNELTDAVRDLLGASVRHGTTARYCSTTTVEITDRREMSHACEEVRREGF